MRILAMDPGKRNWAFALIEDGIVLDYGHLEHTMDEIAKISSQAKAFRKEARQLLRRCELDKSTDFVVAERFMRRRGGGGKGSVSEFINLQLGIFLELARPIEIYLIPAAKWKNGLAKDHGIRKGATTDHMLYSLDPDGELGLTAHEADAIGIGLYCMEGERKAEHPDDWKILKQGLSLPT